MAILTISSTNPNLSHVLSKNPNTILESKKPYMKAIRKGMAYGWYTTEGAFRLLFKDAQGSTSFANDETQGQYEYLDRTRYAHPYLISSMVSDCFGSAYKTKHELDTDEYQTEIHTLIEVRGRMVEHLTKQLTDEFGSLELNHLSGNAYELVIKSNTVYRTLNRLIVAAIVIVTNTDDFYVDLKGDNIIKYARCLNAADASYFMRYLFKRNSISNPDTFKRNAEHLNVPGVIEMVHGDTQRQRMDKIYPALREGTRPKTIHEIGHGEGKYTPTLAAMYEMVFGYDSDENLREKVSGKIHSRCLSERFTSKGGLTAELVEQDMEIFDGCDILITEVFEHIEHIEAHELLIALMKTNFRKFIFTVPDISFNKHYKLDQPFRHSDHKWEPTFLQFITWVNEAFKTAGLQGKAELVLKKIGDKVYDEDGSYITPSLMGVITRISE